MKSYARIQDPNDIVTKEYVDARSGVKSVNNRTGDVTVSELPAVTTSDNNKFLRVVNGAWAAATVPNAGGNSF